MPQLPEEIWRLIFTSLPRTDLRNVFTMCSLFHRAGRGMTYESVDFRSDHRSIGCTMTLLASQEGKRIAAGIKHAKLTTRQSEPFFKPNLLGDWIRLRSLELGGLPFGDQKSQEEFFEIINRSCPQLKSFTYRPLVLPFHPDTTLTLSGLERVAWQHDDTSFEPDVPPPLEPQILSLMSASAKTITHISFISKGFAFHEGEPFDEFLNIRFPHLESLELGSLSTSVNVVYSNNRVTQFIVAHPLIHHLSLGRQKGWMFFQFDPALLDHGSLPALRSLEGFPENIAILARSNVLSLNDLTSLSVLSSSGDFLDLPPMVQAVKEIGYPPLPHVKKLRFEFNCIFTHYMKTNQTSLLHRKWLDSLCEICPNVVDFYGALPPMNAKHILSVFSSFDYIETINLPKLSFIYMRGSEVEYFKPLANRCQTLKKVIARKPPYTEMKDYVYTLHRDATDSLESVTVRPILDDDDDDV
ncbi:hypothetical protein B0H34DRAFT_800626 [Crassisporium funariophilum]|nr:hypothetical protein B0H34DRAFT_800626 [Crassisporium funariophilum]